MQASNPARAPRSFAASGAWAFALAAFLALAQHQLLLVCLGPLYEQMVDATMGVATGHPLWRLFQNRIAAPWMFAGLCHLGLSPSQAFAWSALILLLVFYAVSTVCLRSLTNSPDRVALGLCACFVMVAVLSQTPWFYLWDLVDLSVFAAFTWGLMRGASRWVLLGVTLAELFNREVAVILAAFLAADAAWEWRGTRTREALWQTLAAVALAAGGTWFVEWLRNTLLIYATEPMRTGIPGGHSFNLQLISNLGVLARHLGWSGYARVLPQLILMFGYLAVALLQIRRRPRLGIFYTLLWGSVYALGAMIEWRIWMEFAPLAAYSLAVDFISPSSAAFASKPSGSQGTG